MNTIKLVALALILSSVSAQSATFKAINQSGYRVWFKPFWGPNEPSYTAIEPGQSKSFDSGVMSVSLMRWIQEYPSVLGQTPGQMTVKVFEPDAKIGALELNVRINILNEGSYNIQTGLESLPITVSSGTGKTIKGF